MCRAGYTAAISHDFGTPIATLTHVLDHVQRCLGRPDTRMLDAMRYSLELMSTIRQKASWQVHACA